MTMALEQPRALKGDRLFFSGMAVFLALIVFAGFAPTYFLRRAELPALAPLVHIHGVLFTGWMLLLVTQTTLIARGRPDIHRRLGVLGAVLAAALVVVGFAVFIRRFGFHPEAMILSLLTVGLVIFGSLVALAVAFRRRSETHKRLMLLATISLITPGILRLGNMMHQVPLVLFGLTAFLVLMLFVYDFASRGRPHGATLSAGILVAVFPPLTIFASAMLK